MRVFTPEQQQAIEHGTGPALVSAGPGAGKTAVLTERIKRLLGFGDARILAITFTNAAADELLNRVSDAPDAQKRLRAGTFHSVFYEVLRNFGLYRDYTVLDEEPRLALFTACLPAYLQKDRERCLELLNRFDAIRNKSGVNSAFFDEEGTDFTAEMRRFQELKRKEHVLDFDDMEFELSAHLASHPEARAAMSRLYDYILVDEFQDINPVQYALLSYFLDERRNLFVVGDEDQSIYGFRGSDPSFLLRFRTDFPSAAFYKLYVNFRSNREIVDASVRFIATNRNRFSKELVSHIGDGGTVGIYEAPTRRREMLTVRDFLVGCHRKGLSYGEMAVLFRQRSQVDSLAKALADAGIPVRQTVTEIRRHQNAVLRYITSFLTFSCEHRAEEAFRFIAEASGLADCYIREVLETKGALADALANLPEVDAETRNTADEILYHADRLRELLREDLIADAVSYVYFRAGGREFAAELADREFIDRASLTSYLQEVFRIAGSTRTLGDFIARSGEAGEGVYLGTIHGAKGLEFSAVCCMGVAKGILPHRKSLSPDEIEEERRLLYVGMTRAKTYLLVSGYTVSAPHRSPFMEELLTECE